MFVLFGAVISTLVGVIAVSYVIETVLSRPDWGQVAYHSVVPSISGSSILISVGLVGPIGRLRDNGQAGFLDEAPQASPDDAMIVSQQHAQAAPLSLRSLEGGYPTSCPRQPCH